MRGALLPPIAKHHGMRIDAVCDVYDAFLRSAHVQAGGQDREIMMTADYRRILDSKEIDVVVIATPDHWHSPLTIAACEAGKHIYVEKPLTHKLEEGPLVVEAARRTGMKVQVGAQQRTMPHLVELRRRMNSGEADIGPVHRVHMQWNRNHTPFHKGIPKIGPDEVDWKIFLGNAPQQPFDPWRMRNWRWMWDFGNGPLGDLMVHWLDCTNWLLDLPMPSRIVALGGNYSTAGAWETPDTIHTVFEYPERKLQVDFVATFCNDHEDGSMRLFGEHATVYVDRGRFEITSQGNRYKEGKSEEMVVGEGPRGMGDYSDYDAAGLHLQDWIDAIREDRQPVDHPEAAVLPAAVCHHGNTAYREHRLVEID
jgi:predicted dehydrogenase